MGETNEKIELEAIEIPDAKTAQTRPASLPAWWVEALDTGAIVLLPQGGAMVTTPQGIRLAGVGWLVVREVNHPGELFVLSPVGLRALDELMDALGFDGTVERREHGGTRGN